MGRLRSKIWNADDDVVEVTLNFDSSSILDSILLLNIWQLAAIKGVKVWNETGTKTRTSCQHQISATGAISWSPSGAIFNLRQYGQHPNC